MKCLSLLSTYWELEINAQSIVKDGLQLHQLIQASCIRTNVHSQMKTLRYNVFAIGGYTFKR